MPSKPRVLVLDGPNLNLLGERSPHIYGRQTLAEVRALLAEHARTRGVELEFFQSNHEGALIDRLHEARHRVQGVVINPGALTHYSYALRDAIEAVGLPAVEVHLSDLHAREEFRRISVIAPVCIAQVSGRGAQSYLEGLDRLISYMSAKEATGSSWKSGV